MAVNLSGAELFLVRSEKDKRKLWDALKATPLPWRITVRSMVKKPRTTDQNRRYFLLCSYVAQHTGHTILEVHEAFKQMFLGPNHEYPEDSPTTTLMPIASFADYCECCTAFAIVDLNVPIPTDF